MKAFAINIFQLLQDALNTHQNNSSVVVNGCFKLKQVLKSLKWEEMKTVCDMAVYSRLLLSSRDKEESFIAVCDVLIAFVSTTDRHASLILLRENHIESTILQILKDDTSSEITLRYMMQLLSTFLRKDYAELSHVNDYPHVLLGILSTSSDALTVKYCLQSIASLALDTSVSTQLISVVNDCKRRFIDDSTILRVADLASDWLSRSSSIDTSDPRLTPYLLSPAHSARSPLTSTSSELDTSSRLFTLIDERFSNSEKVSTAHHKSLSETLQVTQSQLAVISADNKTLFQRLNDKEVELRKLREDLLAIQTQRTANNEQLSEIGVSCNHESELRSLREDLAVAKQHLVSKESLITELNTDLAAAKESEQRLQAKHPTPKLPAAKGRPHLPSVSNVDHEALQRKIEANSMLELSLQEKKRIIADLTKTLDDMKIEKKEEEEKLAKSQAVAAALKEAQLHWSDERNLLQQRIEHYQKQQQQQQQQQQPSSDEKNLVATVQKLQLQLKKEQLEHEEARISSQLNLQEIHRQHNSEKKQLEDRLRKEFEAEMQLLFDSIPLTVGGVNIPLPRALAKKEPSSKLARMEMGAIIFPFKGGRKFIMLHSLLIVIDDQMLLRPICH